MQLIFKKRPVTPTISQKQYICKFIEIELNKKLNLPIYVNTIKILSCLSYDWTASSGANSFSLMVEKQIRLSQTLQNSSTRVNVWEISWAIPTHLRRQFNRSDYIIYVNTVWILSLTFLHTSIINNYCYLRRRDCLYRLSIEFVSPGYFFLFALCPQGFSLS